MSKWIHCIVCKSEDLNEENFIDGVVTYVCSDCGFIHNFDERNFDYNKVVEAQAKEKENIEAIEEDISYFYDEIDKLDKKRNG